MHNFAVMLGGVVGTCKPHLLAIFSASYPSHMQKLIQHKALLISHYRSGAIDPNSQGSKSVYIYLLCAYDIPFHMGVGGGDVQSMEQYLTRNVFLKVTYEMI